MNQRTLNRSVILFVPAAMLALGACARQDRATAHPGYEEETTIKPVEDLQPAGDMQPGTTPGVSRSPSGFDSDSADDEGISGPEDDEASPDRP